MELVGIVLWPAIGIIYIVYRAVRDYPGFLLNLLSSEVLIVAGGTLLPMGVVALATTVLDNLEEVRPLYLGLYAAICILSIVCIIFCGLIVPSNKFQGWLFARKRKADPEWQAMLWLPQPSDEELAEAVKQYDSDHGWNKLPDMCSEGSQVSHTLYPLYVDPAWYEDAKYMAKRVKSQREAWQRKKYMEICEREGKEARTDVMFEGVKRRRKNRRTQD